MLLRNALFRWRFFSPADFRVQKVNALFCEFAVFDPSMGRMDLHSAANLA